MALTSRNAHVYLTNASVDENLKKKALLYLAHADQGGEDIKQNGTTKGPHNSNGQVWAIDYTVPNDAKYGTYQGNTYQLEWHQHNVQNATQRNRWVLKDGDDRLWDQERDTAAQALP